ncbi:MAG TPA: glycosyl hydrolase, partial [Solirubrobacterales bacterium]|nr:glycosyl hydrolase [Solirubrobacterales bacterium]
MCIALLGAFATPGSAAQGATYFGATISGEVYGETGNAPKNEAAWNRFERHAGKRVAILNQGQKWAAFDELEMNATNARGAIPLVTMGLGGGVTLAEVAAGGQDAAIKQWALAAKSWGHPFLLAPWWEMNGTWYPWGRSADFVDAWQHFHDVVAGQGATNVTWTWITNAIWSDPASDPTPYYPGNDYVDWVGIDSYNWGLGPAQPERWRSPNQTINPTLNIVKGLTNGERPIAITEEASSEYGGNKADWIREMLTTYLPRHPEIKAYVWFNWNQENNGFRHDWPIESSATAQQAFRKGIQSGVYVPGPVSLPSLTKVPPPPAGAEDPAQAADLTGAAELATGPDVAVAPDGTSTVVWSARKGGKFTVFARRISPAGTPQPATLQLSDPSQDALDPHVAVAPDGTATVAWLHSDGTTFLVQARRIGPEGTPEAATKNLSQTGRDAAAPQVAVGPDGTSTVVWKRFDGGHDVVQERRLDPEGNRVPAESVNTLSASGQDAVQPRVAIGPGGVATVVWSRFESTGSRIEARRVLASGTAGEATELLSASERPAVEPRVAIAGDGTATVIWTRFDGSNQVVQVRRLSPAGTPASAAIDLAAPGRDAVEPELAVAADGTATAAWERFDGSNFVVQARRILPSGALTAGAVSLSASGRDAAEPRVAIAPDGAATVLWSRSDGSNFLVQRRDLAPEGSLGAPQTLSAAGRS